MATKVYMEALSPTMEEGTLVSWLKSEGDEVAEGDVLAEVETDKATMELAARGAGVLRKRLIGEGETAAVGAVIGVIAAEDEDVSELAGEGAAPEEGKPEEGKEEPEEQEEPEEKEEKKEAEGAEKEEVEEAPEEEEEPEPPGDEKEPGGRVKASPLARKLAQEAGLELGSLEGSGPGGRVVKRDVEAALEEGPPAAAEAGVPARAEGEEQYRDLPLSQMRKTIAKRLAQSIGPVPHFFLTREVDMGEAMALRERLNQELQDEGGRVSVNDLILKAVAAALRKHPMVNASWRGEAIRRFTGVHIGVAVAVEEGLITPVVRDADRKGIGEIAAEVVELAGRARDKKLKPEEYTGATFSVSNLGMFGIEEFTAVINPPEAAILAVGAVADRVVARGGEAVVRQRMRITLSCDHRVVDGATGARFLQTLVRNLEDPMMMLA